MGGGSGGYPLEAEDFLKKIKQNEGFSFKVRFFKTPLQSFPSRKRLRAKNTPDLHLTYSNTRGSVG